jgi:UDP-N-acetylglucosamine/UDP-N-acetylgalactosamine diphosphorylase
VTSTVEAKPFEPLFDWEKASEAEKREIQQIGSDTIRHSTVGVVILSGGQGTRLGFDGPKGMYDIGLPSKKTIFQLHIEKVKGVRYLHQQPDGSLPSIPIYIMTSDLNHKVIVQFFRDNNFFDYPAGDVFFFEQALELCLSREGKIIVESSHSLALAPDGNGGIFSALRSTGAIEDMQRRGLKHLHVYGIDNVLTKSADPAFIGLCARDHAECGNKVVSRLNEGEKVGVAVLRSGKMYVAEYSELPPLIASARDPETGQLLFNAANICNHYFSVEFLISKLLPGLFDMYHLASKKIPFLNSEGKTVTPSADNGYKLEMFIFDAFPCAERFSVLSVSREDEFAPVKNQPGASTDSPDTARAMMTRQAVRWLTKAGARIHWNRNGEVLEHYLSDEFDAAIQSGSLICELSPTISYEGEGLEKFYDSVVVVPTSILS